MCTDIRTAIVTGASRGIGRAVAEALAAEGWKLHLFCHRDADRLQDLPGEHYEGDIGDFDFVERVFSGIEKVDLLINNAGVSWVGLLQDMKSEEWDAIIRTNLTSVFNTCHAVLPKMLKRKQGKIINISSVYGLYGASTEVAYSASKGGVNAFTKALAKELAPSRIQVNAVALGYFDTDMNSRLNPEERAALIDEIPACRAGQPKDAADFILSLIDQGDYLTGQVITLDGGWV